MAPQRSLRTCIFPILLGALLGQAFVWNSGEEDIQQWQQNDGYCGEVSFLMAGAAWDDDSAALPGNVNIARDGRLEVRPVRVGVRYTGRSKS